MHSKKMTQKRLIVNADDFGLDPSINSGIVEASKKGIVSSVSVLSCGNAFDDAVRFIKENGNPVGAGIHLALNEERPVLARDKIGTLLDKERGRFLDFPVFLRKFLCGMISLEEIYVEFKAQIERFIGRGLVPTHIDSHKHVHVIPGISGILFKLSKEFNVPAIRIPRSGLGRIAKSKRSFRAMGVLGLSALSEIQSRRIRSHNISSPDYCYGLLDSGCLDKGILLDILNSLPSGTSELVCHPGSFGEDLSNKYRWGYSWSKELEALTSDAVKDLIKEKDIQLIRYDEI